jgi:hypothetical protein
MAANGQVEFWLRSLGLEQYEVPFRENTIDPTRITGRRGTPALSSRSHANGSSKTWATFLAGEAEAAAKVVSIGSRQKRP